MSFLDKFFGASPSSESTKADHLITETVCIVSRDGHPYVFWQAGRISSESESTLTVTLPDGETARLRPGDTLIFAREDHGG